MPARVDVVIPMFESEATIERTIRSLQAQTLEDWRAIVVNDGSTDAGPEIVATLRRQDDRISIITQPNAGLPAARNAGIDAADASYLHFLDADDVISQEALEALIDTAEASGLGAAYGGYEFLDAEAGTIGRQTAISASRVGLDELLDWNRFIAHSQIIRRDLLCALRFDESLRSSEDYDFWLRLAERGVRWAAVDRFVAGYRIRPDSMSKDFALMAHNESRVLRGAYERARLRHPNTTPEREARAVSGTAIAYATRAALNGRLDNAARIFQDTSLGYPIEPASAATSAIFAIQFGSARSPTVVLEEPRRWLEPLDAWWRLLADSRWTAENDPQRFVEAARVMLAERTLHPRGVAQAMLDEARAHRGVVIAGNSPRAHWIGRAASECGIEAVLAPALATPVASRWDDIGELTHRGDLEGAPADAPILLAPGAPEPSSETGRRVIHWETCAGQLKEEAAARLDRVWPENPCPQPAAE